MCCPLLRMMFAFCFPVIFMVPHFPHREENPKEFFLRSHNSYISILQLLNLQIFSGDKRSEFRSLGFFYKTELFYLFTLNYTDYVVKYWGNDLCWNIVVHQSLYKKLVLKSGILGVVDGRESIFPSSLHF